VCERSKAKVTRDIEVAMVTLEMPQLRPIEIVELESPNEVVSGVSPNQAGGV